MIKEQTDLKEFVKDLTLTHIAYMKNLDGFPGECVWSSHMLGSYLAQKGFSVQVVYGTFGIHDLFHAWLKVEEDILDYTLFQFLTSKEKQSFYKRMTKEEMLDYIRKHQGDYWIDKENPHYASYKEIVVMKHQFMNDFEPGEVKNYSNFYENIWYSNGYFRFGIHNAKVEEENKTFEEKLAEMNLRMGKKFFSKKCIVQNKQ